MKREFLLNGHRGVCSSDKHCQHSQQFSCKCLKVGWMCRAGRSAWCRSSSCVFIRSCASSGWLRFWYENSPDGLTSRVSTKLSTPLRSCCPLRWAPAGNAGTLTKPTFKDPERTLSGPVNARRGYFRIQSLVFSALVKKKKIHAFIKRKFIHLNTVHVKFKKNAPILFLKSFKSRLHHI